MKNCWKAVGVVCYLLPLYLSAQQTPVPTFEGNREGLAHMLEFVLQADEETQRALTRQLTPSWEDYDEIFLPLYARDIYRFHKRLRRNADIYIHPLLEQQTEYLLWETTPAELEAYEGEARHFPGGYREFARYFQPGIKLYRFKFVEPGWHLGSSYDIMAYVNGNWKIFHRPWAVMIGEN